MYYYILYVLNISINIQYSMSRVVKHKDMRSGTVMYESLY